MTLRIGELARRAGTTVRTVRYYEEIGVLPGADGREAGAHRSYDEDDVERLQQLLRLRDLLGLSLDELRELVAAEHAREARRAEFQATSDPQRRRAMLLESRADVRRQLSLLARRQAALDGLRAELTARGDRIEGLLGDS